MRLSHTMRISNAGLALLLCMLITLSAAEQHETEPSSPRSQQETKTVYLGNHGSVPLQVPVGKTTFTWSGLMVEVMKGTAVNIGATLGYDLINSLTGNFFGLLDKDPDQQIMDQLKVIENLVRQVDYKIDSLTKDVAQIQISVQLGNVNFWTSEVQGMFDIMNNIFEVAPYQSPNMTKRSILVLLSDIRHKAYQNAQSIYSAMVTSTPVEDALLKLVWTFILNSYKDNTDAFDVYGIMRSFSTHYLTPLTQASTLLNYAYNATGDLTLLQLAKKVDGFIESWDQYLETGTKPLIDHGLSNWARLVLQGSPDETKIGWNTVFELGQLKPGTNVECDKRIQFLGYSRSTISMRRPTNWFGSWVFASTNGTSAEPVCTFMRSGNDIIPRHEKYYGKYWWGLYTDGQTYEYGHANFAVIGYYDHRDHDDNKNPVWWYDMRADNKDLVLQVVDKPQSGQTPFRMVFANGRVIAP